MSRTDEVHRITENVYKSIMEQFNPCLRNFVAMGKSYEKALTSVTSAAKGYFDALLRMGEAAGGSRGAEELAEVVPQRAADGAGEESADGRSLPQRGAQEVPDGAQEQRRESGEVSERAEEAPTQKSERQNARQARRAANAADGGHDGARRQNPARTSAAGGAQKQRRPAEVDGSRRRGRRRRRALPTAARVQSGGRAPGRGVVLQHVARTQGGARQEQDLAGVARHPAPLQLDGGGPGEERARRRQRAGAGALLARGRRQRHAAELQARRPGDAAGARGQRRLALRRERGDAHARLVSLLVHTRHRGGRRRLRRATSAAHPPSREEQQHGKPPGQRRRRRRRRRQLPQPGPRQTSALLRRRLAGGLLAGSSGRIRSGPFHQQCFRSQTNFHSVRTDGRIRSPSAN
ncbi:serine/arginine repetitive matrix protein 1-like isoform X5 [Phycodurus eques]|uniref:serine/arginine repetitive matrix protein 1-like isoform X5 n=1 Tax=Phycodurus eques TaxID=693459 RepID=UPI002ACE61DC|nr:serine/arginine repetitive matrix protein 1-like isoform X5 [Phycodurus eques]